VYDSLANLHIVDLCPRAKDFTEAVSGQFMVIDG
jgi:hypothetical protein